jgi:hypothetical protein
MAEKHLIGNGATVQLIGNMTRPDAGVMDIHQAVPVAFSPCPYPTSLGVIGLFHVAQKALLNVLLTANSTTLDGAKATLTALDQIRLYRIGVATVFAEFIHRNLLGFFGYIIAQIGGKGNSPTEVIWEY